MIDIQIDRWMLRERERERERERMRERERERERDIDIQQWRAIGSTRTQIENMVVALSIGYRQRKHFGEVHIKHTVQMHIFLEKS